MSQHELSEKNAIEKIVGWVEDKLLATSMLIIFLMTIFISIDACSRYLFNKPIPGSFELTEEYFMPAVVFLALSAIYTRGGHVSVTMLDKYIPAVLKRPIAFLMDLLSLGFALVVTGGAAVTTLEAIKNRDYSISILAYPMAPIYGVVFIGSAVLSVRLLISIFKPIEQSSE